ncbi:hypothetical protein ABVT39_018049 [Epinephelus coioides]
MTPWQVLRANRVTRAGLGYRGHHGPGVLVHYSTAPNVSVAAVAPDNSRTFCLSREKLDLQQLNRRLATYLQQVQYLEATNQRLERQIQEELNRKCPRELKQLNGYLRTASLLHDQISERLSSQAQVKLQLLSAELTIFDFKARYEKEHERRGCVETDVSDLRLLEEVLKVHTLPELRTLLEDQTQQLMELRIQHQQDMQGLLAQASGGVTVEMQAAGSSDLLQQLDDLRQTSVTLLGKNQNECLFNTQVSMLSSPEVTFNPPAGSEVVQAELEDLRRTAASLEEELTHLQAMNMGLEASGLEQTESVVQQLQALQQRADDLCRDLDSVLQATAQQAADYQTLLDVKNRLETEIEDYRRLLDGLSQQGLSSLHSNSAANFTPFYATTSPSAHRRNISANKTVPVHRGNLRMMGVQTVSRGYIHTVRQTPIVNPLSNHSKNSPVTSINTSNLTGSFHKSEKQTTEETQRESMTIKETVNRQSNPVKAKVHSKDCDLKNSPIVSTKVSQSLDKGAVLQASKSQINAAQVINTLVPDTKSAKSAALQAKPETYTSKQVTAEAGLQANKTDTHIQTEITKAILYAQPQVKQGPHIARHLTTADLNKETAAEIKTETQTMITAQKDCTGGSNQAKNQDPAQTVSLSLEVSAEVVKNAEEAVITASSKTATKVQTATTDPTKETAEVKKETKTMISAQMVCTEGSNQANNQDPAQVESLSSDPLVEAVMDAEEVTTTAPVVSGSQGTRSEEVQDKVSGEGAVVKASKPDSNTAQGITTMVPDTKPAMNASSFIQEITETTEADLQANKTATNVQTEIAKTIPEVKQGRDFVTHTATTDPTKETASEVKKVTETVISAQIDCTGGSNQAKNQDPAQVASLSLDPPVEPVGDAVEVEVKASTVSGSHIFRSEEAQDKVSDEGAVVKASKPEVNTTQGITSVVPDTQPAMNAVQEIIEGTSEQTTTEAGLQANKTGTNVQTEITKTILCAEPEVQQGPDCVTHTAATDPTKETVAEVKTVTESVISAHVDCTEGSIQAKSQDPAKVVSLSLETPAEVVRDAEEVAITAPVVSGSQSIRSEEAQNKVSGEGTVVKASIPEINTVQGITTVVPYTQPAGSAAVQEKTETFTSEQTTEEAGWQDNKTGTNIQTEITKTILCTEPEVNQEPHFVTHTATMDPAKETAAEVKKETEIVISAKMNCTEGSIQAKDQDPAQLVSLSLETPAGAVRDAEGVAVTASIVSGSHIRRSEEAQNKVSGELTLIDDKDAGSEENKGVEEVEFTLFKASNSEHNKVMKDAGTGSGIPTASFGSPDSKENLESKTTSTEILKKVEIEINKEKAINGFHDTNEVKVERPESDNDMVYIAGQEVLQSTTKLKKSVSLTDSGVALSSSDQEEVLSPSEADVYMSPTPKPFLCLSSETCLSPIETEVLMCMTDQVFCPVDLEEHVRSPDYLLSPNDPEMFLSQNDPDKRLSPIDAKGCLSPKGEEEDEDVCLSLTEANTHVRPVEKYILSTKEEGQSLSFSSDQALPGEDRNREVSISVEDGNSLCFGSFDGNKGSRGTVNEPTSQGINPQLSSSHGGLKFGSPGGRSIIADKEEQLGFRGLYRKGVSQARTPNDGYKVTGGIADNKDVQNASGSPGGRYGSEAMKEISSTDSVVRGQKNNDWLNTNKPAKGERLFVRSSSFGGVPANGGTTFSGVTTKLGGSGMANDVAACFGVMAANSSGTAGGNTVEAGDRFRRGSGDWLVYGGSVGRTSTNLPRTGTEESPSGATLPATSDPETGRFGRGSGEWVVYSGSFGRKSSLDSSPGLPSEGKVEGPSVATNLATSPQETGRFSCRGSEGWMVYGGSLGRKNSLPRTGREESPSVFCATSPPDTRKFGSGGSGEWMVNSSSLKRNINMDGSNILPNTESRESQSTAMHLPTSPPGTGRFSSRSGEWRVYGGSTGYVSNVAGSNSLSNVDSKESPSVAMQLATSPPGALRPRRFGSGDSGEWRVYGGSTGRLSSASNAGKVGVSTNYGQVISPPSSYTSSGPRLSSTGSGGRLSSGGVVRRSSSVGSGGRLSSSSSGNKLSSSSGSNRISSSGRFTRTGSGERKPVYSSASGRRSTSGTGRSGGGGTTSNNRAPSPGGRMSLGSGGWLNSSTAGVNRISSPGSGSRLSSADSSDRISSQAGGRISSSSGSGRTNSTGGRVISSSDRPVRSTGSGAGGNKERISVCKMAALSISAAGRERSQDRQRQAQQSQQQQVTAVSPLVQRWLTTGVGVTSAESDGLDDIIRL